LVADRDALISGRRRVVGWIDLPFCAAAGVTMAGSDRVARLRGRRSERVSLEQLVTSVREGQSGVLVLRGEAGIGKTALLDHLASRASDCRIARAAGVESEMELAFAGLHQLCAPFLDRLDRLPDPQRNALGTAFGLMQGDPPDRFLIGVAALGLLSDVAEERPLLCLVDDAHWLDQASAQTLAFVARRLGAESVALVLSQGRPSTKAGSQPIVQDRPAHADSPGTPRPDGRTVQPGRSPVTRTWTAAPTNFIPGTNAIESVNARIRRAVRARGHFPNEAAALKCIYMALMSLDPTGKGRKRWTMRWKAPPNAFQIAFEGRLTPSNN